MRKLNEIYLINEELLKQFSNMSRNVGIDKILPYINLAQPFYIAPILGEPLMEELQEQISTNTLTELNKALILKIAPSLSLWVDFLAARSLAYTITAKGITREHSENSESLDKEELGYYIGSIRESAEQATELLIKYLCKCRDEYPLWRPDEDCNCNKYTAGNEGSADNHLKSAIYFPSGRPNKCGKCDK